MILKDLLKEKDISCAQLSRKMNKKRQTVNCWTLGQAEPSLTDVKLISEILNVSVDDVLNCFVKGA